MSEPSNAEQILKQMLAERARLAEEVAATQRRLEAMDQSITGWAEAHGLEIPRPDLQCLDRLSSGPVSEDFKNLALPAAAKRALEKVPPQQPKTASEILAILERHNAAPVSEAPVKSVQSALNRRKAAENDVVHVLHGRWGLRSWYTDAEIAEFEAQQDGANARDRQLHSSRMKAGIKRVKATGAHYGAPPKITPLQWQRATELVRAGVTSMPELHREMVKLTPAGDTPVTRATAYRQRSRLLALESYPERWKTYFDAHPPAPPASEIEDGKIRAVK